MHSKHFNVISILSIHLNALIKILVLDKANIVTTKLTNNCLYKIFMKIIYRDYIDSNSIFLRVLRPLLIQIFLIKCLIEKIP